MIKEEMSQCSDFKTFEINKSTKSDFYNIILMMNTKSSQGYDKIPPKILKMCANEIAHPLSNIINISIDCRTFVDTAKISLCTPL